MIPFDTNHSVTSAETPTRSGAGAPARLRLAVEFSLSGDLRFLSHHDEMRMLARAAIRSRWPLRFSQGFNPKPRFTLPLPRSVGVASECELAVFELCERRDVTLLATDLREQFPAALRLRRAGYHPRPTPHPVRVRYRVNLGAALQQLPERIAALTARETLVVHRSGEPGSAPRRIDVRPMLDTLEVAGSELHMRLTYVDQRTARPTEILELLDLDAARFAHRITRASVEWDTVLFDPADGIMETEEVNFEQGKEAEGRAQIAQESGQRRNGCGCDRVGEPGGCAG